VIQTESSKCRYRVDAEDVMTWVDDWWLAFARENGAAELTEENVLGHSLWDFIADNVTQELYQEVHNRVRSTCRRIVLPFRCDAPTLRRHMLLTITPEDSGHLLYEGVLTHVEPCPPVDVLDPSFPRSQAVLTMCSNCKQAMVEPYGWLEIEDAVARLGLFEKPKSPRLNYTVCHGCKSVLVGAPEGGDIR
jgi:hypothetical protein